MRALDLPHTPLPRWAFRASLAGYLLVRVYLGLMPGYAWDTELCKTWALGTALDGVTNAYQSTSIDYPPLYLYLIRPIGGFYLALHPELRDADVARLPWDELVFRLPGGKTYRSKYELWANAPGRQLGELDALPLPHSRFFTFLIKLPNLVFDLLTAAILYALVAAGGTWGRDRRGAGWGRVAASVYLWNPAVLWWSAYSGAPDAIHCGLVVGSLALVGSGRFFTAGVLLALGGLMKPLAAPLVPVLAVIAGATRGIGGFVAAGTGGLVAALVVMLPFFVAGVGMPVIDKILGDIDIMPFTSVNGHNIWWIFGGWQNASAPGFMGLTPKTLGLVSFGTAYVVLLLRSRAWLGELPDESGRPAHRVRIFLLAAAVMASFFFLSTHMHENHFFSVIPLLIAVAGWDRRLALLALAATLSCVINGALHDLTLPYASSLWNTLSPIDNPQFEGFRDLYTWPQLIGSYVNSVATGITVGAIFALACGWVRRAVVTPEQAPAATNSATN